MYNLLRTIFVAALLPSVFSAAIQGHDADVQIPIQPSSTWKISPSNRLLSTDCSKIKNYTALGDSIAAGLGAGTRLRPCQGSEPTGLNTCTTEECKKYSGSYANAFAQKYHVENFQWLGCAGATTNDVIKNQLNPSDFGHPNLVTIHAGADNGDLFTNVAINCINPFGKCDDAVKRAHDEIANMRTKTMDLIDKVQKLAQPNALIVVLGYYQMFEPTPSGFPCSLIKSKIPVMNSIAKDLDDALRIPDTPGVVFVDVDSSFDRHRVCSSHEYMFTPFKPENLKYPKPVMHPNLDGHAAILKQLEARLGCG